MRAQDRFDSHAQRDGFEDAAIIASPRAGRLAKAEVPLAQCLARRPSTRDQRWLASIQ
jgi:hypothetical protein